MEALRLNRHRPSAEEPVQLFTCHLKPASPLVDLEDRGQRELWRHARCDLDRPRIVGNSRFIRVGVTRLVARSHEVLEGLGPRLALGEVMGQLFVVVGESVRIQLLDRLADGPNNCCTSRLEAGDGS